MYLKEPGGRGEASITAQVWTVTWVVPRQAAIFLSTVPLALTSPS